MQAPRLKGADADTDQALQHLGEQPEPILPPRAGYEDAWLKATDERQRQNDHQQAGIHAFLKSRGVETETLPDGAQTIATHPDGQPVWKPATSSPFQDQETGQWVVRQRDDHGNLRDVSAHDVQGAVHTDAKTGDQYVYDANRQPVKIGVDQGVVAARAMATTRSFLYARENQAAAQISDLNASLAPVRDRFHEMQGMAATESDSLGGKSQSIKQVENTIASLQSSASTDPAVQDKLKASIEARDRFYQDNPEYAQIKATLAGGKEQMRQIDADRRRDRNTRIQLALGNTSAAVHATLPDTRATTGQQGAPGDADPAEVTRNAAMAAGSNRTTQSSALVGALRQMQANGAQTVGGRPIGEAIQAAMNPPVKQEPSAPEQQTSAKSSSSFWKNMVGTFLNSADQSGALLGEGVLRAVGATDAADEAGRDARYAKEVASGQFSPDNPYRPGGPKEGRDAKGWVDPARKDAFTTGLASAASDVPMFVAGPWAAVPSFTIKGASEAGDEAAAQGKSRSMGALKGAGQGVATLAAYAVGGPLAKGLTPAIEGAVARGLATAGISTGVNSIISATMSSVFGGNALPQTPAEWGQRLFMDAGFGLHASIESAKLPGHIAAALNAKLTLPEQIQLSQARLELLNASTDAVEREGAPAAEANLKFLNDQKAQVEKFLKAQNPKLVDAINEKVKAAADMAKSAVDSAPVDPAQAATNGARAFTDNLRKSDILQRKAESLPADHPIEDRDQLSQRQQASQDALDSAHKAAVEQVPEVARKALAAVMGAKLEAQQAHFDEQPDSAFQAAHVGQQLRDLYTTPEQRARVDSIVARVGEHGPTARFIADQHVGMRAARDLTAIAALREVPPERVAGLQRLGLVEMENGQPVVTHDALHLLPKGLTARLATAHDAYRVKSLLGEKMQGAAAMVRVGQGQLERALHAKALATRAPAEMATHQVRVQFTNKAGKSGETTFDVKARSEEEATANAMARVEKSGAKVDHAEVTTKERDQARKAAQASDKAANDPLGRSKIAYVDATAAEQKAYTPEQRQALARVESEFARNKGLFKQFGIDRVTAARAEGDASGIATSAGRLSVDPAKLLEQLAIVKQRAGHDVNAGKKWVRNALMEEVVHQATIKGLGPKWVEKLGAAWNDPAMTKAMKDAAAAHAAKTYDGFENLDDHQKAAEVVRMVVQGKWKGTITEQVVNIIRDLHAYLTGLKVEHSPLLQEAIDRTRAALIEARKQERVERQEARKAAPAAESRPTLESLRMQTSESGGPGRQSHTGEAEPQPAESSGTGEETPSGPAEHPGPQGETRPQRETEASGESRRKEASSPSPEPATPAAEAQAEPEKPSRKPNFKFTVNDGGFAQDPIVARIMEHGGLLSKSATKGQMGAEKYARNAGESEDAVTMKHPSHNAIYSNDGMMPDEAVAVLHGDGRDQPAIVKEGFSTADLWAHLDRASRTAKGIMEQEAGMKRQAKDQARMTRDFEKDTATKSRGEKEVTAWDVSPGDTVQVGTEAMKVVSVDAANGSFVLEDGHKYGTQEVEGHVFGKLERPTTEDIGAARAKETPEPREDFFEGFQKGGLTWQSLGYEGRQAEVAQRRYGNPPVSAWVHKTVADSFKEHPASRYNLSTARGFAEQERDVQATLNKRLAPLVFTDADMARITKFANPSGEKNVTGMDVHDYVAEMANSKAARQSESLHAARAKRKDDGGQRDMFAGPDAPFNLAGEKGEDGFRVSREKEQAQWDAEEAARAKERDQMTLFASRAKKLADQKEWRDLTPDGRAAALLREWDAATAARAPRAAPEAEAGGVSREPRGSTYHPATDRFPVRTPDSLALGGAGARVRRPVEDVKDGTPIIYDGKLKTVATVHDRLPAEGTHRVEFDDGTSVNVRRGQTLETVSATEAKRLAAREEREQSHDQLNARMRALADESRQGPTEDRRAEITKEYTETKAQRDALREETPDSLPAARAKPRDDERGGPVEVGHALLDADTPILTDLADIKGHPDAESAVLVDRSGVHHYDLTGGTEPKLVATSKVTGDKEAIAALTDAGIPKVHNLDEIDRGDFPEATKALVIRPNTGRVELVDIANEEPIATARLMPAEESLGAAKAKTAAQKEAERLAKLRETRAGFAAETAKEPTALPFDINNPGMQSVSREAGLGRGVWMTKTGDVIPVPSDHNRVAADALGTATHGSDADRAGMDAAYRKGWARVLIEPREKRVTVEGPRLTTAQSRNLRDWTTMHAYEMRDQSGKEQPTAPEPHILTKPEGRSAMNAYYTLKQRTGFPAVSIADLADQSGVPLDRLKQQLLRSQKAGSVVLSTGDWSLASDKQRAGVIEDNGQKMLRVRFLKESGDLAAAKAVAAAHAKVAQILKPLVDEAKTAGTKHEISQDFDYTGTHANIQGLQAQTHIRLPFERPIPKDESRAARKAREAAVKQDLVAARPVVEAGGSKARLAAELAKVNASTDAKLKAKFAPIYQYALDNFDRLNRMLAPHVKLANDNYDALKAAGVDVGKRAEYVHRVTTPPEDPNEPHLAFEMGNGNGSGNARGMLKGRSFDTMGDAIKAGYDPGTYGIHEADGRMVQNATRIIGDKAFLDKMKQVKAPTDGKPIISQLVKRRLANGETDLKTPDGYAMVQAMGRPLVIHKMFAPLFRDLYGTSAIRNFAAGRALLKLAAAGKHGTLVFDTFHVGRLLYKMAAGGGGFPIVIRDGKPVFNYHAGLSMLEYSDADLATAVKQGEVTPEEAAFAKKHRAALDELVKAGLNVGKVADNLMDQVKRHVPVITTMNDWIFGKLSRGAMVQTAMKFYERNLTRPGMTREQAARRTATEMNEYFGNLQNQGIFKSKTLQDIARLVFLAPNWTESQARYEARAYGQLGASAVDAARGKGLRAGNATRAMATGFVALLAANQVANYLSRGQSTFENEEDGHKLDAWVPGGRRGFWFNPFEIAGEYAHAAMKYTAQHENPVDVATHILSNKLSPLGRGVKEAGTGRDAMGRHFLSDTDRFRSAAVDTLPSPLPLGGFFEKDPRAPIGYRVTRANGGILPSMEKQAMQSLGAKVTAAQSPRTQLFALAQPFRPEGTYSDNAGQFTNLKSALDNDETGAALTEMKWLMLDQGKDLKSVASSLGIHSGGISPERYTGSKEGDQAMLKSFTPKQRALWQKGQDEHAENAKKFLAIVRSPEGQQIIAEARKKAAAKKLVPAGG